MPDAISGYYYTVMGGVFVGSLCSIGVFLLSAKGYDKWDRILGCAGSVFANGVALFPTNPKHGTPAQEFIGTYVHPACATALFLILAFFCLFLFTKTGPANRPTRQKRERNIVYRVSGSTILACMALIGLHAIAGIWTFPHWLFWYESIAIFAFGFAWLIKGEFLLKDK